jgi:hypothetical protein
MPSSHSEWTTKRGGVINTSKLTVGIGGDVEKASADCLKMCIYLKDDPEARHQPICIDMSSSFGHNEMSSLFSAESDIPHAKLWGLIVFGTLNPKRCEQKRGV